MFQRKMFIGGKKTIPLTPYTITASTNLSGNTGGSGSTGNGDASPSPSGSSGNMRFGTSWWTTTNSASYYKMLKNSSSPNGSDLYWQNTGGSSPYVGGSAAWLQCCTYNLRYDYLAPINWQRAIYNINGNLASTTWTGEVFTSFASGGSVTVAPTNYAGGTLFIVTVAAEAAGTITISGGEGTGSATSLDAPTSLPRVMNDQWVLLNAGSTGSDGGAVFAYYRSGSVDSGSVTGINVSTQFGGATTSIFVGVSSMTTAEYDTGPIGPVVSPTPSPTSVTPTPTPTISVTPSTTPPPNSPTPTPSVTPTISVTPSITPSTPGAGDTGWMKVSTLSSGTLTNADTGLASSDGVYAYYNAPAFGSNQVQLRCDGLSAALASATTLIGVEIRVTGYRSSGSPVQSNIGPSDGTQLNTNGSLAGMSTSSGSPNVITQGGPTNTLGATIADLQNANSGLVLYLWAPFGSAFDWYFDYIEIRVYYS